MKMIPVLVTIEFTPEHLATLQTASDRLVFHQVPTRTPDGVVAALNDYPDTEVLYAITTFTLWQPHWHLRWIQIHWAGIDHIPLDAIPPYIQLTTASGIHAIVMAEHIFALLLALRRCIGPMVDLQRQARWPKDRRAEFAQPPLHGQTMGILGYGSIGREVARLAQAFGMRVLAYKRSPHKHTHAHFTFPGVGDPSGSIPDVYYGPDSLFDLLKDSDVLVNVLPATSETEGLLNPHAFAAMKPTAFFINVGRGKTVDEEALVDALRNARIRGAALDVFAREPLPASSPLWHFENVIISPHVGGMFPQYHDFCVALFRENLIRYLAGQPLLNEVDRRAGY